MININIIIYKIGSLLINYYNRGRNIYLKKNITSAPDVLFGQNSNVINNQSDYLKLKIGRNSRIDGQLIVFPYGEGLKIGENCYVGENSRIWAADRIRIGDNVLISHNVNIMDTDSHEIDFKDRQKSAIKQFAEGLPKEKGKVKTKPIIIEDNVWISFNSTILKGVKIGRGSIIGCNSVVIHDVPPFSLAIGSPAKVVKSLNEDK